ncbi:hypothetical protein LMTR13_24995 [Bradyrhizobium icense]|uniref:Electron transfer flavoprotein alpha subunit C-terminal domain-containing protein n=1 Tax=Bradyrhizobium icense TaxID=1274631 RepID=A0A1B1UJH9_9BRAD|nr:hypothetical protein LMTR13_24995 [Bradyrhizobium icense]
MPGCDSANVNLASADVVGAEGLGLRWAEKYQMAPQIAAVLRAEYGCSGPLAQKGWVTYARQSGHTGKIIWPKLSIAAGISGAILHRVGVKSADLIVAISIEKNAPIFELAHIASDANRLLAARMAAFVRVCGRTHRELEEAVTIEVRFDAIVVDAGIAAMPPRYLWPNST